MKILNCDLSKINYALVEPKLISLNYQIAQFVKNYLIIWPLALGYHTPMLFKNVRDLTKVAKILGPHLSEISTLGSALLSGTPMLNKQLKQLGGLVEYLSTFTDGKESVEISEGLSAQRVKINKISTFFSDVLLKSPLLDFDAESESLSELAVTMRLMNALIDDLSSRAGMFSKGKARSSADVLQAQAQAVTVEPLARVSPFPLGEEVRVVEDEEAHAVVSPRPEQVHVTSSKSLFPKRFIAQSVATDPLAETTLMSELSFLDPKVMSYKEQLLSLLKFLLVDVILGVPRFMLIELPTYIKTTQEALESLLKNMKPQARGILELKELLIELSEFSSQWKKLDPVFSGLEIYLKAHQDEHMVSVDSLKVVIDQLYGFVETTDQGHLISIIGEFKGMISKVNPLLTKALDSIQGRSLAAVVTPNPFSVKKQPGNGAASPLPQALAGGAGTDRSSSSSDGSAPEARPAAKDPAREVAKFFKGIGEGIRGLAKAPVAGATPGATPTGEL